MGDKPRKKSPDLGQTLVEQPTGSSGRKSDEPALPFSSDGKKKPPPRATLASEQPLSTGTLDESNPLSSETLPFVEIDIDEVPVSEASAASDTDPLLGTMAQSPEKLREASADVPFKPPAPTEPQPPVGSPKGDPLLNCTMEQSPEQLRKASADVPFAAAAGSPAPAPEASTADEALSSGTVELSASAVFASGVATPFNKAKSGQPEDEVPTVPKPTQAELEQNAPSAPELPSGSQGSRDPLLGTLQQDVSPKADPLLGTLQEGVAPKGDPLLSTLHQGVAPKGDPLLSTLHQGVAPKGDPLLSTLQQGPAVPRPPNPLEPPVASPPVPEPAPLSAHRKSEGKGKPENKAADDLMSTFDAPASVLMKGAKATPFVKAEEKKKAAAQHEAGDSPPSSKRRSPDELFGTGTIDTSDLVQSTGTIERLAPVSVDLATPFEAAAGLPLPPNLRGAGRGLGRAFVQAMTTAARQGKLPASAAGPPPPGREKRRRRRRA